MTKENQYQLNKRIEAFIREKDLKKEFFSEADIRFIQQYEGAGGLGSKGATGEGVLYEFYTPDYICELMYELVLRHGYDDGSILDPAIATGRLVKPFPDKSKITGFEINPITARICEITYPEAKIHAGYFETTFLKPPRYTERIKPGNNNPLTWLPDYPFSLVIGNPPYGKYKNKYSSFFKTPKMQQVELMFIYYSLKLLKSGGLLVFITSSNFLRNGISYTKEKTEIGKMAELIDAYRLPPVFKTSQVPTDIIVLKRK
jgi:type I restriction-modification system DNA methylase subunit